MHYISEFSYHSILSLDKVFVTELAPLCCFWILLRSTYHLIDRGCHYFLATIHVT